MSSDHADRDRFETPRVGEGDPDALRALVRQRRDGPSVDSLRKIESGLAAAGVMQASPAAGTEKRLFYPKLAGLFLIVAGGLLLGRQTWRESPKLSGSTALVTGEAVAGEAKGVVADAPNAPNAKTDVAPAPAPKAEPLGTLSVNELPTAAPPAMAPAPAATAASSNTNTNTTKNTASPVSELVLIQRAQSALASDPPRALSLTGEHARTFPSGEFVQEREVIAVEALSRLGRKDEARERASALLKRFPRTPYAARLEMATSTPLSKTSELGAPANAVGDFARSANPRWGGARGEAPHEKGAVNPTNPNDPANAPATPAH